MTRRYTILLHPEVDDRGYSVTVPSLPGCVTQGKSIEQCVERAREAIALHIAALEANGEPVPDEVEHPQAIVVDVAA
jgi:predicted RNase H-like HicB family nuclease